MEKERAIYLKLPLHHYSSTGKRYTLSLNWSMGSHWSAIRTVKTAYIKGSILPRLISYKEFTNHPFKEWKITYQFKLKNKRRLDPTNFWSVISKFLLDALVYEGYIIDDGHKFDRGCEQLKTLYNNRIDEISIKIEEVKNPLQIELNI